MSVNVPPGFYDQETRRGQVRTGQITVGTALTSVIANNQYRLGVVICNNGANTVYLGPGTMIDYTDGHALPPGAALSLSSSASLHGITQTGSSTVTFLEEAVR